DAFLGGGEPMSPTSRCPGRARHPQAAWTRIRRLAARLVSSWLLVGAASCVAPPSEDRGQINVTPSSLDEAGESIAQIEALLRLDRQDRRANDALQKLRPVLD